MLKNFDFSWFLTTPGILTCVGCLLIIVAIIIFISTLNSKRKDKKTAENTENKQENIQQETNNLNQGVQPVVSQPVNLTKPVVASQPVTLEPQVQQPVTMESQVQQPVTMEPQIQQPVTLEPQVQQPVTLEPQIQQPVTMEPQIQQPVTMEPQVTPLPSQDEPTISTPLPYGGVSPIPTTPININDQPKPIYGGANPLDGTGVMPTITNQTKTEEIESL